MSFASSPAPRLLIVEDDADLAHLIRSVLPSGLFVVIERDGIGAVSSFRQALRAGAPFTTVCLDLNLPGMDGGRVLRSFRRVEAQYARSGRDIARIVIMTTASERATVKAMLAAGVDDYLVKPFTPEELLQRLELPRLADRA